MTTTWISFGPDLEPMASQARRSEGPPQPRRDGLAVHGSSQEIAAALAEAAHPESSGWCALETGDPARTVHVNARVVRFVVDEPD